MKKIIKKTIEYQNYRKGFIMLILMFIGLFIIMCVPFLTIYIQNGDKRFLNAFVVFSIIDLILFIPFIFYYFFRMFNMIKIGNKMKLMEVELNDFKSQFLRSLQDSYVDESEIEEFRKILDTPTGDLIVRMCLYATKKS